MTEKLEKTPVTDEDRAILKMSNNILNSLNLGQVVEVVRAFAVNEAKLYYNSLTEEEKKEAVNKLAADLPSVPPSKGTASKEIVT